MAKTLFSTMAPGAPLAERLRPKTLAEVVGQEAAVGQEGVLTRLIAGGLMPSLIFWGPPGCGKTTISRLLAKAIDCEWMTLSAVASGVADLKAAFEKAARYREDGKRTLLFVDEIHRFNRAQQDAFLPVVEDGTIILVGATTENPSFELNGALLSRCRVVVLSRLNEDALLQLMVRAEAEMGRKLPLTKEARVLLAQLADGDGRYVLNLAEELFALTPSLTLPLKGEGTSPQAGPDSLQGEGLLDEDGMLAFVQKRAAIYDKAQESHYNLISALHKSLRGSDVDAALYWFCRMLDGGEDPRYIGRRMVRFASEDIGMADPQALLVAEAGVNTYERLGSPEGELALAHVVVHLATAPKSNAVYTAFKSAMQDAKTHGSLMPPKHILNAPTKLMKELGYSAGYEYDHHAEDAFSGQNYFPEEMERQEYYMPAERGFEREVQKRLDYWKKLRDKKN